MKRLIVLLFALLLLLPSLVFADVIVEPENSFYRTHQKECQHRDGRTYLANGPEGTLNVYTAPRGTVARTLENGTPFYCQWTYTDKQGIVWGFSDRHEGWMPLGYTLVRYDHIAFQEECADKIVAVTDWTGAEYETVYLYEYPGASDPLQLDNVGLMPKKTYTDDQGRRWGFVPYIYGIRDKWFCLDEPANDRLIGEEKAPIPSGFEEPASLPTASTTAVIAWVVGIVALVTLVVVLVLFRKKRREN